MPTDIDDIKSAIKTQLETVDDLLEVRVTEPTSISNTPCVTIFTEGFMRAPVESPFVDGTKVVDPIGGRTWLWLFKIRLWIDLRADVDRAQVDGDDLAKRVVEAWEADKSLGGIANDAAIASGRFGKVTPQNAANAKSVLMCEMDAVVEVTEAV